MGVSFVERSTPTPFPPGAHENPVRPLGGANAR